MSDATDDIVALIQLSGLVQETFARVAGRYDLTAVQGRLLCVLDEQPRGMAELARVFGVGKANLTGLIDRAAQRGLVSRCAVPGDRRAFRVILTEEGRDVAGAFHAALNDELAVVLAALTPSARACFRDAAIAMTHAAGHSAAWGSCNHC
jgi:DNA-binding MarR family transcriptional regulator